MPLWVARQWHVPGVARSAAARLLATGACAPSRRTYSQLPLLADDPSPTLDTANAAIIIPKSVAATQPGDLIKHIAPLAKYRYRTDRFIVFFVTPAFATWLLDDNIFLRKALHQAYSSLLRASTYAKVHALVAVVDKLPTSQPIEDVNSIEDEAIRRVRTPPTGDAGYEGIAYSYMRASAVGQSSERTSMDDKGSISFTIGDTSIEGDSYTEFLQMPLANTVFQTGTPTTMALSSWEKLKEGDEFNLLSRSDLVHQNIRIRQSTKHLQHTALAIPLIPITAPRPIEACMGNILRRVTGVEGKSVTASEELEKVVPQYFKSRGEPSQSIVVWAMLIPKHLIKSIQERTQRLLAQATDTASMPTSSVAWESLWKFKPPQWNDLVTWALDNGARLHRVLSGGGGWGKKAGLLSLDPSFNNEELTASPGQDLPENMQGLDSLSTALHQLVHPGDSIQFFVSPPAAEVVGEEQSRKLQLLSKIDMPWTWELGLVPSTVDAVHSQTWQHTDVDSKDVFVLKNSFGALAEGGMTLKRQRNGDSQQALATVSGTKVDVPFARFGLVDLGIHSEHANTEDTTKRRVPQSIPQDHLARSRLRVRRVYTTADPHEAFKASTLSSDSSHDLATYDPAMSNNSIDTERRQMSRGPRITKVYTSQTDKSVDPELLRRRIQKYVRERESELEKLANVIKKRDPDLEGPGEQASNLLRYIRLRANKIHTIQSSARAVYELHLSLRHVLAEMITQRSFVFSHRSIKARAELEKRYVMLRSFGKDLFLHRRRYSHKHVRSWLFELEKRNDISGKLVLSTAAQDLERMELRNARRQRLAEYQKDIAPQTQRERSLSTSLNAPNASETPVRLLVRRVRAVSPTISYYTSKAQKYRRVQAEGSKRLPAPRLATRRRAMITLTKRVDKWLGS